MSNLYSAVNNTVATISNCEDEPIHIPGSIQPHGFLLVIEKSTGKLALCSDNIGSFLPAQPAAVLSQPYQSVLPAALADSIAASMAGAGSGAQGMPVTVLVDDKRFDCFARHAAGYLFVECVPAEENPHSVYDLFLHTNGLLELTDSETTLYQLCTLLADKIRGIIAYDRVMVYRFDEDDNGFVFAESVADGVDQYLNLHYPSTDIPKQARQLYLKTLVRLIPNVGYQPSAIVTLNAELARPEVIDMSNVHLRSVSPIHIQYLKNMGVGATFTISLIKDGALWGLIACHNNEPKIISHTKQIEAYLLSHILSSQIGVQETAEKYRLEQQLAVPLKTIRALLEREENFIELHFSRLAEIPMLVNAAGVCLRYKNKIYCQGNVPPEHFVEELYAWLQTHKTIAFATENLSEIYPPAESYKDTASGLLYHQLNATGQPSLLWFRPSINKVIKWAGNPNIAKQTQPLTPRASFAAWEEMKTGVSQSWVQAELDMGRQFAYLLQRHIFYLQAHEEEVRYRRLNEQLVKANKELENINWISTHDLKEPLRKIQVFASMLESPVGTVNAEHVRNSIDRIRASATKMQNFVDDLLLYSKMLDGDIAFETVSLDEVIEDVLLHFEEEKEQGLFTLQAGKLPAVHASHFQMNQLFINLVGNAIKFRSDSRPQHITITCEDIAEAGPYGIENGDWYRITVADTGVGFNDSMATAIFDVFKRAHTDEKFKGTGVGLSICRKIIENHGGRIVATGKEGEGAAFSLFFPKKA